MTTPTQDVGAAKELYFQVEDIRFYNPDSGWGVLLGKDREGLDVTVTGVFAHVHRGMMIKTVGEWQKHQVFGNQWVSQSYVDEDPRDQQAMVKFIHLAIFSDITGLGKRMAEKIVETFQDDTASILDRSPHRLKEVKGFPRKHIKKVASIWAEHRTFREAVLLLTRYGLSLEKARKVLYYMSPESLPQIRQNPYILLDCVPGFGFKTVDALALAMDGDPYSNLRVEQGILFILKNSREQYGHCYLMKRHIFQRLPQILQCDMQKLKPIAEKAYQALSTSEKVIVKPVPESAMPIRVPGGGDGGGEGGEYGEDSQVEICYLRGSYKMELEVGDRVSHLVCRRSRQIADASLEKWLQEAETLHQIHLSTTQKQAVKFAVVKPMFILTGGAGVGKTTALKALLYVLDKLGANVALASPTGRAAQRMKEVSGKEAQTLHRLLEWEPLNKDFALNEEKPLLEDVIVVDESSMMDLYLAVSLLRAISGTTQLVIIGDPHQLPSIGSGSFLGDLIRSSQVPHITLHEIFRQAASSPIILAARSIQNKEIPQCFQNPATIQHFLQPHSLSSFSTDSATFIPCLNHEEIVTAMIQILQKQPFAGMDALSDIQILTPVNKGDVGCDTLNHRLQTVFQSQIRKGPFVRPKHLKDDEIFFCKKDKVIQTVNNYDLHVFNGDIGYVQSLTKNRKGKIESMQVQFVLAGASRIVVYEKKNLSELKLAYAITIHKAQGSEFPVIFIPLTRAHYALLSQNLLYTAITRAKKHLVFFGDREALGIALKKPAYHIRFTYLAQLVAQKVESLQADLKP